MNPGSASSSPKIAAWRSDGGENPANPGEPPITLAHAAVIDAGTVKRRGLVATRR